MNNNDKRKVLVITTIVCVSLLVGILGSYAFFISTGGNNKPEELSVQTGNMVLVFEDGTDSFQGSLEFGSSAIKTFTIENTGSIEAKGRMKWNNLVNTYLEGSLTYTLSYSETEEGEYTPIIENRNVPTSNTEVTKTLAPELVIPVGKTYYYKLIITLNYLEDVDQTADLNAILGTNFKLEEASGKDTDFLEGSEKTLSILNIKPKEGNPDFANTATTDETADGLYAMQDDYGTSYYYRGSAENNYVKFAGFWWRIIRINGDGSLRMIYDGQQAYTNGTRATGRVILTANNWNKSNCEDAKFVGYMYGGTNTNNSSRKRVELGEEGYEDSTNAIYNETDSNIKIELEKWYKTNIADKKDASGKSYDEYVSDEIFCNDRSIADTPKTWWTDESATLGYGTNATAYGAFSRFMTPDNNVSDTPKPQFICPNQNDAFTKSDTKKGNGKLGEKVGLITIDEVVAAGGNGGTANPDYYLCKGVNYLSFSPYLMNRYASTYSVSDSGRLGDIVVLGSSQGSAPVINLSPEYISQMTRDGTIGNEYRIE